MNRGLRILFLIAAAVALSVPLAIASHGMSPATPASSAAGTAVTIDNFSFGPATLTVPAGSTVVWTNHDDLPHNVVERDQKFKSKALDTDDSLSHSFTEPETYEYFCGLHPKMVSKIVVEQKKYPRAEWRIESRTQDGTSSV